VGDAWSACAPSELSESTVLGTASPGWRLNACVPSGLWNPYVCVRSGLHTRGRAICVPEGSQSVYKRFIRHSQVFEGNVSEGSTLEKMLKQLHAPEGALIIMDAGIASEENLEWLTLNKSCLPGSASDTT